jgi:hypothetical protein
MSLGKQTTRLHMAASSVGHAIPFSQTPDPKYAWWLSRVTEIYWINAKATSLKFTLMKFIRDKNRRAKLLKGWCRLNNLRIASRFFGIMGGEAIE